MQDRESTSARGGSKEQKGAYDVLENEQSRWKRSWAHPEMLALAP